VNARGSEGRGGDRVGSGSEIDLSLTQPLRHGLGELAPPRAAARCPLQQRGEALRRDEALSLLPPEKCGREPARSAPARSGLQLPRGLRHVPLRRG